MTDDSGPDRAESVIAVDVGGTEIKAARCDRAGVALAVARRPTPVSDGVPAVLDAIAAVIEQLAAGRDRVCGVGLIMPGEVDAATGIARYSANIGWRELAIRDQIRDRVGLPVAIEHDVRAAGLAEFELGAGRGATEALFLAIGTGIAGATLTGGRLVTGARNLAGEIGHLPVVPDGELCACGQRGCAETYASAAALPRRYLAAAGDQPAAAEGIRAEQVLARAAAGDPVAGAVFDQALTALARALVSYVLLLDPALVVIGGGLSLAGDELLAPLAARIQAGLAWRAAPALVTARFGADSGRVGAALVGWRGYDAGGLASSE